MDFERAIYQIRVKNHPVNIRQIVLSLSLCVMWQKHTSSSIETKFIEHVFESMSEVGAIRRYTKESAATQIANT